MEEKLSLQLKENIDLIEKLLPIGRSFDFVTRQLYLGETAAYWLGINGFCRTELLQQLFSDLQNPLYVKDGKVEEIALYMASKIGYAQVTLTSSWQEILHNVLSGPSVLFIDGFDRAILIDVRTYPTRSVEEPETEKITRGARDGFVETLLFNANLIRRRVRSRHLTFAMHSVGRESQTDVAVCYLEDKVDQNLLARLSDALNAISATSLTMGGKSLEELLIKKRWWSPLPSIQMTERPDVASSYLSEGHLLVIVDNSPTVLIFPGSVFQFIQSPEDYYKSPLIGSYFRLVRLLCIPVNLLLLPLFLLIAAYFPETAAQLKLLSTEGLTPPRLIFYVFVVEFLLDLFRYSASLTSSQFSGTLSIIGGLLIGDIAVSLNWASTEVFFYAAITLLTSMSLPSIDFADALRVYRLLLILGASVGSLYGFGAATGLVVLSAATTPTFGGFSYFWPLFPFHWEALKALLFRRPTAKAQPSRVWRRK